MKKTILSLTVLALLTGCSSNDHYTTKVDKSDEVVVTGSQVNVSKQDIFEYLMDQYGANYVLNRALQDIAANYELDEEALQDELTTMTNSYKSIYGEDLDAYAKENLGYDTWEAYQTAVLLPSLRQKMMIEDYADNNFATLAEEYYFVKLRAITVSDESTAISLIADLNNEEITFEEALEEYGQTSANTSNGDLGVVSDLSSTSQLDPAIQTILPQLTEIALYSVPVQLTNYSGYAIIDVVETDKEKMQAEILNVLRTADAVTSEAEAYYLKENQFKVYDKRLEENIKAIDPDYIQ